MLTDIVYAMGPGGGAGGQGGAPGGFLIPLILMFGIMYFMVIRPQQKQRKQHEEMINNLRKGDKIMTGGGIHGRIVSIDDAVITLEIADKVRIKINKAYVGQLLAPYGKSSAKDENKSSAKDENKKDENKKDDSDSGELKQK